MAKSFQVDSGNSLTTGLISYYKLSDGVDFYGSNNGTAANVTFNSASGKVNNGGSFNGTSSSIDIGTAISTPAASSIFAWINFDSGMSAGNVNSIYAKRTGTGANTQVHFYAYGANNSSIQLNWYNGTTNDAVGANLSLSTWYHVGYTLDGSGNLKFYINGSQTGSTLTSRSVGAGASVNTRIGSDQAAGGEFMKGLIDELGIWSKALSTTEISDLYNGGAGQTMITPASAPTRRIKGIGISR